eukprot:6850873-Prymnesium_polylepis.1
MRHAAHGAWFEQVAINSIVDATSSASPTPLLDAVNAAAAVSNGTMANTSSLAALLQAAQMVRLNAADAADSANASLGVAQSAAAVADAASQRDAEEAAQAAWQVDVDAEVTRRVDAQWELDYADEYEASRSLQQSYSFFSDPAVRGERHADDG